MDIKEAYDLYTDYLDKGIYCDDDEFFIFTEVAQLLYERTGEAKYMRSLGGMYYERKEFDLARKYYEIAAEKGDHFANIGLGYIWYYGRTGERDYKKAFEYFSRCKGDINAEYKLADMYHTGKYVEKDEAKYEAKIEEIYELLQQSKTKRYVPEIYSRLARIRMKQGMYEEAYILLCQARGVLADRIMNDRSFGDYEIMKGIIRDLHSMDIYYEKHPYYDIFDMYVLFEKPCKAELVRSELNDTWENDEYPLPINAVEEDGAVVIEYEGEWYRSADDFIKNNNDMLEDSTIPHIRIISMSRNQIEVRYER